MHFRYRDNRGRVVPLPDVASLLWAIREGSVLPDTPLAVDDEKTFQKASLVVAYQQAAVAVSRSSGRPVSTARGSVPWHVRKSVRFTLAAAVLVLAAMAISLRIQAIGRQHARQFATKPSGPPPATQSALARFETEFGDSAALAQRRLEDWVDRQRFGERLRGSALRAPASLRGVRAAIPKYRREIDSLMTMSRNLAVLLVQRADSAEGAHEPLAGLMTVVEDALVEWQRELGRYADLQRATAASIDSLTEFLLERQQSFALREGQPIFLSRADAARFRELSNSLAVVAGREKAWADALLERRPTWMSALSETARPRFGRNLLSDRASNSP